VNRVQWTSGLHVHTVFITTRWGNSARSTLPIHAHTGWCIGSS